MGKSENNNRSDTFYLIPPAFDPMLNAYALRLEPYAFFACNPQLAPQNTHPVSHQHSEVIDLPPL